MNTEEQIKKLWDVLYEHVHNSIDGTTRLPQIAFVTQTTIDGGVVFVATRPCFIKRISEVHATTATGATVVEKLVGTESVGAGTNILVSDIALSTAANTVTNAEMLNSTGTALNTGDRIGTYVSGSSAGISYQCITFEIQFT